MCRKLLLLIMTIINYTIGPLKECYDNRQPKLTNCCQSLSLSCTPLCWSKADIMSGYFLKGIYPEFQVIRGFSQKILADLLSYDQIHS